MKKRLCSSILALAMASTLLPVAGAQTSESVKVKGRFETRVPVYAEYTGDEGTVQWYSADSEDGVWTAIDGATSKEYIPSTDLALKWIKVGVSDGNSEIFSEPKQLGNRIYSYNIWEIGSTGEFEGVKYRPMSEEAFIKAQYETPGNYIFNVDGQEFILLDTTEDDDSHFLVMSRRSIGDRTATYQNGLFPSDLLCWLNDDTQITRDVNGDLFTDSGLAEENADKRVAKDYNGAGYRSICDGTSDETGFTKLPNIILQNIDENAVWKFSPRRWEGGDVETTARAGISIPAYYEYEKYSGKFGWNDFKVDGGSDIMWMRTASITNGVGNQLSTYDRNNGYPQVWERDAHTLALAIRPMFYLNKDFFLEKVFSLEEVGSEVRNTIVKSYNRAELESAGYNTQELDKYYDDGGVISNVQLRGEFQTQMPARVELSYDGNMAGLVYEWYSSDTENGEYTLYTSKTGDNTYELPVALGGKYIKVKISSISGSEAYTDINYVEPSWDKEHTISHDYIPEGGYQTVYAAEDGKEYRVTRLNTVNETTPSDYVFTVGEDESAMQFILLDTLDYDDSRFLVLSKNKVDTGMKYPTTNNDVVLGNAEMMAFLNSMNGITMTYLGQYWFNQATTDYTKSGYIPNTAERYRGNKMMTMLPDSILASIDYNHHWKVESRMWEEGCERVYKCGITIPAMHEIRKYSEKIGLWDDGQVSWWTRTPNGVAGDGSQMIYACCGDSDLGDFSSAWGTGAGVSDELKPEYCIRPMFCLDKDYFIKYKIDLSGAGKEVIKTLTENYTYEQMIGAGYTADELAPYYEDKSDSVGFEETLTGKKATFNVTNCSADGVTLILALYDNNNKLVDVLTKFVATTEGQTIEDFIEIENTETGLYAKAMIWDGSIERMSPKGMEQHLYQ